LENKKEKRKTPPPSPAEPFPGPNPQPHLPANPRSLSPRPNFGLLPRARQPALRSPSLSLAKRPHPSAALPLARSLPLAVRPRLSAASSSFRRPFTAVTSGHRLRPPLRLLTTQGSLAPLRPPLPLTSVLAGTAPPWCPLGGAVRHLWAALCSSPEPRSSTAPLPSRTYKRLAPSSFFLAPSSAIPLLPFPEHNS
jgi:hypothetical protein